MLWRGFYSQKLEDQEQANQLVVSTNQNLDVQLKSLEGLQEQRNAIVERMKLIQGLQGQRPVAVRLVDEMVRVTPVICTLLSLCVQVINLPLKVKRKARIQLRNSYVISKHLRGIAMPL